MYLSMNERLSTDGYCYCLTCGGKTALVSPCPEWSVDEEAFKADEPRDPSTPATVILSEEICGHYCFQCERLTAISVA